MYPYPKLNKIFILFNYCIEEKGPSFLDSCVKFQTILGSCSSMIFRKMNGVKRYSLTEK